MGAGTSFASDASDGSSVVETGPSVIRLSAKAEPVLCQCSLVGHGVPSLSRCCWFVGGHEGSFYLRLGLHPVRPKR